MTFDDMDCQVASPWKLSHPFTAIIRLYAKANSSVRNIRCHPLVQLRQHDTNGGEPYVGALYGTTVAGCRPRSIPSRNLLRMVWADIDAPFGGSR